MCHYLIFLLMESVISLLNLHECNREVGERIKKEVGKFKFCFFPCVPVPFSRYSLYKLAAVI